MPVPNYPFRCPGEGWYLRKVQAIFARDLDLVDSEPELPLLVYGSCKKHGWVWLTDMKYYTKELWEKVS